MPYYWLIWSVSSNLNYYFPVAESLSTHCKRIEKGNKQDHHVENNRENGASVSFYMNFEYK